jgi:hypothetical protein
MEVVTLLRMKNLASAGVEEASKFFNTFNNTVANVENPDSLVNYGAWGAVAAFSILLFQDNTG